MLAKMMVAHVDVLGARAKLRKSGKLKGSGVIFKYLAIDIRLVQMTGMLCSFISLMSSMMGITSRKDIDIAIYSASVVDSAVWIWSLEAQMIGHPA